MGYGTIYRDQVILMEPAVNPNDAVRLSQVSGSATLFFNTDLPFPKGNDFNYDIIAPNGYVVSAIKIKMSTVNSVGAATLTVTNVTTGNTVLNGANYNLGSLVAATVTGLGLTATSADKTFSTDQILRINISTASPSANGLGLYLLVVGAVT
jgi:hypothetical protein